MGTRCVVQGAKNERAKAYDDTKVLGPRRSEVGNWRRVAEEFTTQGSSSARTVAERFGATSTSHPDPDSSLTAEPTSDGIA
jgi:hypothetical protein